MLTLTPAEKSRALLYKIAKGNPQAIIAAIDEVRRLAQEALAGTVGDAERKALEALQVRLDIIESKYEREWKNHFTSMERLVRRMVNEIEPRKGEKGDKGDKPSTAELLMLIEPLIPFVKDGEDGKVPDTDALRAIMKPLVDAAVANAQPTIQQRAEAERAADDKLAGLIANEVAKKISEVKRFGGGGSGDRVKAGTGVSITTNAIGQKVISAAGSFSTIVPTGDVNASNVTFVFSQKPTLISINGAFYRENHGWTWDNVDTATLDFAPGAGGDVYGIL